MNSDESDDDKNSSSLFDFDLLHARLEKSYKQVSVSRKMRKFYARRYQLFTRFDSGVLLDQESWFSVTPEAIARHVAHKCFDCLVRSRVVGGESSSSSFTVLDAFCGSGGNTIQFARLFDHVIATDIDFVKLQCAQHNSNLYGTAHRTSFYMQDFFSLHKMFEGRTKIDMIFLSPPWGGVDYIHKRENDLSEFPLDTFRVFLYCKNKLNCSNLVLFLPRNSNVEQIAYMAGANACVEVEQNFLGHKLVAISAYYDELCDRKKFF